MNVQRIDQFGTPILAPHGVFRLDEMLKALESAVGEGHDAIAIDLSWVETMSGHQARVLDEACRLVLQGPTQVTLVGASPVAFRALECSGRQALPHVA